MPSAYETEKQRYEQYLHPTSAGRHGRREEIRTSPLVSLKVKHHVDSTERSNTATSAEKVFPQYGLLGHHVGDDADIGSEEPILLNVDAPSSALICGSQGCGKSYTLSCMLENCLLTGRSAGTLESPVAGAVFHYNPSLDGTVAEVAHLCSLGVKVNVYVSRSNEHELRKAYEAVDQTGSSLVVKPLLLRSSDLSIDRINKLMAVTDKEGPVPLYMTVVQQILRQMAIDEREFSYAKFKARLNDKIFTREQRSPMQLRLDLLESFLDPRDIPDEYGNLPRMRASAVRRQRQLFDLVPGTLTIIDLSDTFIDSSTVCMLFDVCLSVIQEQRPACGLAIVLDEAHKYMGKSSSAAIFTDRLLSIIREQRHNGSRVIIATQEPTISEKLLDLCSVSIVHRFTSPAWFGAVQEHLGGASSMIASTGRQKEMCEEIFQLGAGESLVFAPSAFVVVKDGEVMKLGTRVMKMKTRARVGTDGGLSVLASRQSSIRKST